MIPYGTLYYFYILFLLLIPAIILGYFEKPIKHYGLLASLLLIGLLFSNSRGQLISIFLFYIGQLFLIKTYLLCKKRFHQQWLIRIFILCSLLPLALVKWGHFLTDRHLGFLGVSYLTFKAVQMLLEINDGLIEKVSIFDFTYFLLFFPTMSSGPINRSRRFQKDLAEIILRKDYFNGISEGLKKILLGAVYKFCFGSLIFHFWLDKLSQPDGIFTTLSYMYGYSFYLFFDFAGYSLLAIGVSYFLGVNTPENFNKPFISKDIKDFWNRWHMSLSFWFRDYIYNRFVMTALKNKTFRSRYTASYLGYMLTMTVMGIWHGSEIYYMLYGVYHGILIIFTDFFQRHSLFYKKYKNTVYWNIASTIFTFHLVCFGFLIFSGYLFKN